MTRRGSNYTDLGRKISNLATNQAELAKTLDLTQQSISGKLMGKIAVTLKDLKILSETYKVPLLYFFTPEFVTIELARAWEGIMKSSPEAQQAIVITAMLPDPFVRQVLRTVQAVRATAAYYTDPKFTEADALFAGANGGGGR